MADNVTVTPGTGATVATDDVAGVQYQRTKVGFGTDGTFTDVNTTTPLPVLSTNPWDRNPLIVPKQYVAAGHATGDNQVVQWTYTVPVNRKAILLSGFIAVIRATVATTAKKPSGRISYTVDDITKYPILFALVPSTTTTGAVYDRDIQHSSERQAFLAGSILEGITDDNSVGGTVDYQIHALFLEFDA